MSLILVDGSFYLFRAFYAFPYLFTSTGIPVGAVYGMSNMIKNLMLYNNPNNIIVIFDSPGENFRKILYPDYKKNRKPVPNNLISQFNLILNFLDILGLPVSMISGVEADDIIGTLSHQAIKCGIKKIFISTVDKDFLQLVNSKINIIHAVNKNIINIDYVKYKFGIYPNQIIDYLSLVGDKADNIPGIPYCGHQTAIKLLRKYKTLKKIIINIDCMQGKFKENLKKNVSYLSLYKKLVTIKKDILLPKPIQNIRMYPINKKLLISFAKDMEFTKAWLNKMLKIPIINNNKNL